MDTNNLKKISLCIPTMNRFDLFLSKYIPLYLDNPYIDEIVICDETGDDYEKLTSTFSNPKLKVFKNETCLGAFHNKLKVVEHATNPIVCLMDSDNFCDTSYFEAFQKYIQTHPFDPHVVYCPEKALPRFIYSELIGKDINIHSLGNVHGTLEVLLNTGNYIFSRDTFLSIRNNENSITKDMLCYDVIYMNYLLMKYANVSLQVVPGMTYSHVVHDGSYYLQTHGYADHFYRWLKESMKATH